MLQSPCSKDEGTKPCLPNFSEALSNPAFNMSQSKLYCSKMRFMELCDNAMHDSYGVLEVCNLDDILDQVADKMDNVWEVEHCWNSMNKEFLMKPSVSSAITYDCTYP